jgi:hypothetical protein
MSNLVIFRERADAKVTSRLACDDLWLKPLAAIPRG